MAHRQAQLSRLPEVGAWLLRRRLIVRAPIWLYRARLGGLLGSRLIMLEHRGRKTGARRFVVLEVVDHPEPDCFAVVSGFGGRAQWFRNVMADPRVRIIRGSRRSVRATARLLDAEEARAALSRYAARHPRAWGRLRPVLERTAGRPVTAQDLLPVVSLCLTGP